MIARKRIRTVVALSAFFMIFCIGVASCQSNHVDSVAHFIGGSHELDKYIKENMNWRQGQLTVEGKVYVSFTVLSNGKVQDPLIEKSLCETCDKEAIRLVQKMPDWIPAVKSGQKIDSKVVLPIPFSLSQK